MGGDGAIQTLGDRRVEATPGTVPAFGPGVAKGFDYLLGLVEAGLF